MNSHECVFTHTHPYSFIHICMKVFCVYVHECTHTCMEHIISILYKVAAPQNLTIRSSPASSFVGLYLPCELLRCGYPDCSRSPQGRPLGAGFCHILLQSKKQQYPKIPTQMLCWAASSAHTARKSRFSSHQKISVALQFHGHVFCWTMLLRTTKMHTSESDRQTHRTDNIFCSLADLMCTFYSS